MSYNAVANEIAVYGNESDYYFLVITSIASQQQIFEAVLDGNYDTIDASIMSSGAYTIALTSAHGRTYKWTFNNGLQSEGLNPDLSDSHFDIVTDFNKTKFERE